MPRARSAFIWTDAHGRGRNQWALFRRTFLLGHRPAAATLSLFADTRYRLVVNGRVLGHGPARFYVKFPEYDTYDLAGLLGPGENVIAVLVNSYGCHSFHAEKSVGGLWADLRILDRDGRWLAVASDAEWRAIGSPAHRSDTGAMSFALNPAEFVDARAGPLGWTRPDFDDSRWPAAVLVAHPGHWGHLTPRSIPLLDERKIAPVRGLGAWVARDPAGEDLYSLMALAPGGHSLNTNARVAATTYIHSPRDQTVTFGAWWGRYWLNGEELKPTPRQDVGMRQDWTAHFRAGWNRLLVVEYLHWERWDLYLGLPRAAGLEVSAEQEVGSPHTFLLGGPWDGAHVAATEEAIPALAAGADLPPALGHWHKWPRGKEAESPVRERAWKTFEPCAPDAFSPSPLEGEGRVRGGLSACERSPSPGLRPPSPSRGEGTTAPLPQEEKDPSLALLYDFGAEVLGRPVLDFTTAEGTVVDLAYTERLRRDGVADVHAVHFVEMVERYVAAAGRQEWQTFHPRGMRYLEVLVRGDLHAFQLHEVGLARANYPAGDAGEFECSDPMLNRIWQVGRETLHACMEDAYVDCPWRERGLYSGDFYVQFHVNLAACGDFALVRRCIDLFLQGQGPSGTLPGCALGVAGHGASDYSMILPQAMRAYAERTGDRDFLGRRAGRLARLMTGLAGQVRPGEALMDGTGLGPYIDIAHFDKGGVSASLNCFYQRTLADAAWIMDRVGRRGVAEAFAGEARRVAEAIRAGFWDDRRGAFVDRLRADVPATEPSVQANALAIFYGIATPEQQARAGDWLAAAMLDNFRGAEPRGPEDCNVSTYFAFYALGALYKCGKVREAEAFMRTYWGRMIDRGAWTFWEYFTDNASLCHAWSACPTYYLSSEVLGVTQPDPQDPDRIAIRPHPGTLQWARGTWPHARGPIRVSWRRQPDGTLAVEHQAPEGVEIVP